MGMKRVIVHIDRLVLDGLGRENRQAVADGLQQELARLLAPPGVAGNLAARFGAGHLEAPPIRVPPAGRAGQIGALAAQAIARRIGS